MLLASIAPYRAQGQALPVPVVTGSRQPQNTKEPTSSGSSTTSANQQGGSKSASAAEDTLTSILPAAPPPHPAGRPSIGLALAGGIVLLVSSKRS